MSTPLFVRSVRRSKHRLAIVDLLRRNGPMYLGELAAALGAAPHRVRACLAGELPGYRVDLGLVRLGLVSERATEEGPLFGLTERGRRGARAVLRRAGRRALRPATLIPRRSIAGLVPDEVETPSEALKPGEDPKHPGDFGPEEGLGAAKHPAEVELQRLAGEVAELRKALVAKEAEAAKVADLLRRSTADFDNYRKRAQRAEEDARARAKEELVQKLLDVVANFDRAIEAAGGDEAAHEGVTLIYRQLRDVLRKEGVERIDTTGHAFDPRLHEAVMREEAAQYAEGTILQEFESGWTLSGRVIRAAKVKVATKPREPVSADE